MALGQSVVLRTITGPMLTDTVLDITRLTAEAVYDSVAPWAWTPKGVDANRPN
jgi:hypothetical protein